MTLLFSFIQDCTKNTAKCVTINCVIYNMPSQSDAFITVKARLWNSTLVADYPRVDQVTIVSSIEISIPEIYNIQQLNSDDHKYVRFFRSFGLHFDFFDFWTFHWIKSNLILDYNTSLSRFTHSTGRWIHSHLDYNCIDNRWFTSAGIIYILFVSFGILQATKTRSNA